MPLYEYECEACGKRFEIIQKFSDAPPDACRVCGKGPVRRLMSSPAIQFKGSGWYITDYAQKGKSDSSASAPAGKAGDAAKSDTSSDASTAKTETPKSETPKSEASANVPKSKE